MFNFIYHNSHWGKSRKSVEILNKENIKYSVIEYLKTPLNSKELINIFEKLNIKPNQAIRKNEAEFKDNNIINIINNDAKLIDAIIKFPKILERPIIIIGNNAVIGRPPEKIYDIIWSTNSIISKTLTNPSEFISELHSWLSFGKSSDVIILTKEIISKTFTIPSPVTSNCPHSLSEPVENLIAMFS